MTDLSDYLAEAEMTEKLTDEQLNNYVNTFVGYMEEDGTIGEKCKDFLQNNPVPLEEDQKAFLLKVQEAVLAKQQPTEDTQDND